jgi:hypothetical protein
LPASRSPLDPGAPVEGQGGIEDLGLDAPSCFRAATWSCIRAMRGETTMPVPGRSQGGKLVAQGLAAAGGHQHQGVATGRHVLDDVLLGTAELGVTEDVE